MKPVISLVLAVRVAACAELNDLNQTLFNDPRDENAELHSSFDRQRAYIEDLASVDRSLAGRGTWVFDGHDDEFHSYSIAFAQQVDSGRIWRRAPTT
jgi:hypothetical protein